MLGLFDLVRLAVVAVADPVAVKSLVLRTRGIMTLEPLRPAKTFFIPGIAPGSFVPDITVAMLRGPRRLAARLKFARFKCPGG